MSQREHDLGMSLGKGINPHSFPRLHRAICHAKVCRHRLLSAALDLEAVRTGKQSNFDDADDLDQLVSQTVDSPDTILTILALEVLGQGKWREGRVDERVAVVSHYRTGLARQPGAQNGVD